MKESCTNNSVVQLCKMMTNKMHSQDCLHGLKGIIHSGFPMCVLCFFKEHQVCTSKNERTETKEGKNIVLS